MSQRPLTSSEIACLWTSYMQNSMSKCVMEYFLEKVKDPDIQPHVKNTYDAAVNNLNTITEMFVNEQMPIPVGFSEQDVNLNAKRLFSDTFFLQYLQQMGKIGLFTYSVYQAMAIRTDIQSFFSLAIKTVSDLNQQINETTLSKGLMVRPPYIPEPKTVEFVQGNSYFSGFSIFNEKRPLNAVEISYLYANIQTNLLGMMLSVGFSQTAQAKAVRKHMYRGSQIAQKHVKVFADILVSSNIQAPITWDAQTLDSTEPLFSDKLMMFHNDLLIGAGIGNYASSSAASLRNDLSIMYVRLSAEIAQYAKDGAKLMVENRWLEEPPQAPNRKELMHQK